MRDDLNVMVDIDDVLFPWADGIHEKCRVAGLHDIETYTSWSMWEDYGVEKEAWLEVVDKATIDGFYQSAPYPHAVEALRSLRWWMGSTVAIHLVTARGMMAHADDIRRWTVEWVEDFAVPHDSLTFTKDKVRAQEKLGRFDYALDDGAHNFEALLENGIEAYLLDRPHNQDVEAGDWRVYSVGEFVDIIVGGIHA